MGMAVAEEVAKLSHKKLDFGNWDGDDDGRPWIRSLRALIKEKDADTEDSSSSEEDLEEEVGSTILLSFHPKDREDGKSSLSAPPIVSRTREPDSDDDSLVGYESEGGSSRAPSPTPSELEEIEKDPSLRTGGGLNKKKVTRPVYLVSLGELLRPSAKEGEEEVQKVEIALTHGEELIRRRRDYGTELGTRGFMTVRSLC